MPQSAMSLNLGHDPVRKCFQHFLLPAITGMVIKSLYIVADIMFIGHSMGEDGLAAINIVLPYFSFMFAVAMMVGVGGGALMSIRFGEDDQEGGRRIFQQALTFVTLVMISAMAKDYVVSLTYFATPYAVGWVLSNFVRNDNNPTLVMKAMIASASLNVVLDWLFMMVFKWEMFGAGLATGLAQLAMTGVLISHFWTKNCRLKLSFAVPDFRQIKTILGTGLPTLLMEASVGIVILISNWVLYSLGGTLYLSVYTVILNCLWLLGLLVYGVSQAVQPLISFNHGARRNDRILETINLGMMMIGAICLTFAGAALVFPHVIVAAFVSDASPEMISLGEVAMRLYGLSAIPMGFNVLVMTIYQATARARASSILSLFRSLLLPIAGLFALSWIVDGTYVWANILIADLIVMGASIVLLRHYQRRLLQNIEPDQTATQPLAPVFMQTVDA